MKVLIHGCLGKEAKHMLENSGCELVECDEPFELKGEALEVNCMMDIPDYLKGYKPKGRSKADRKRSPRWPRR